MLVIVIVLVIEIRSVDYDYGLRARARLITSTPNPGSPTLGMGYVELNESYSEAVLGRYRVLGSRHIMIAIRRVLVFSLLWSAAWMSLEAVSIAKGTRTVSEALSHIPWYFLLGFMARSVLEIAGRSVRPRSDGLLVRRIGASRRRLIPWSFVQIELMTCPRPCLRFDLVDSNRADPIVINVPSGAVAHAIARYETRMFRRTVNLSSPEGSVADEA